MQAGTPRTKRLDPKLKAATVILLLGAALCLRLYSASRTPLIHDEKKKITFAQNISFHYAHRQILIGDPSLQNQNPILSVYLIKLGIWLFGESPLQVRLPFILLSTVGLFFIFKLVDEHLGEQTALITLYLLAFDQYHLGTTRYAYEESLFFFFIPTTLYIFWKSLVTRKAKYLVGTGVLLGLGCLTYEGTILFFLIIISYLILHKKYGDLLRRPAAYLALVIMLLIFSPHLYWTYTHDFPKIRSEHVLDLGLSLRSIYLYFAELLPIINRFLHIFEWNVAEESIFLIRNGGGRQILSALSLERAVFHWPMGLLIFSGLFYWSRQDRKNDLLNFCSYMFTGVFIATSLIAGSHSLFDDHWWAGMTIFPGIILCAYMLKMPASATQLSKTLLAVILTYFFLHTVYLVHESRVIFAIP